MHVRKGPARGNNQYHDCSKSNGWIFYTAGRRPSDLGGFQGWAEERGEAAYYINI